MASSDQLESIEIPGRPTLRKTFGIPPRDIHFPLVAFARFGWRGVAMLVVIFVSIGITFEVFEWALSDRSGLWILKLAAALLISLMVSFIVGTAVTRILDSARSGAVLIIDGEGVMDTLQLRTILRWADVKAISFSHVGRGDLIVVFKLRAPILIKYNPFRHGFRRAPIDELYVWISGLDKDEDVIGSVIKTMVVRNGGYVVPYVGAPWEPPKKIVS